MKIKLLLKKKINILCQLMISKYECLLFLLFPFFVVIQEVYILFSGENVAVLEQWFSKIIQFHSISLKKHNKVLLSSGCALKAVYFSPSVPQDISLVCIYTGPSFTLSECP